VSAAEPLANKYEFDSVKSILVELNGIYAQQAEIRETLEAKGVPAATVNMLVNLLAGNAADEFEKISASALKVASDQVGIRAIKSDVLVTNIRKLVELDEDALFIRRIARGMEFNPQAISMLTNIIRQNPGDSGKNVLTELFSYAVEYGVPLEGLRSVEGAGTENDSVLPEIIIEKPEPKGLMKYKDLAIELAVAAVATYTVLHLLT